MEDYLRSIEHITDSLASIRTPIPYIDLVQLNLNGLDEDYHNLVTTLSYGTNLITFDDLRSKFIHYEQRLKFLKSKDLLAIQHQALATLVAASKLGKSTSASQSTRGMVTMVVTKEKAATIIVRAIKIKGNSNQHQQQSSNQSVPIGTACGNNSSEAVFGSHPNVICQICFAPEHTAVGCPQRYTPSQNVPAFATFNAVDANESIWYPNSTAASHMTPHEGNLLSKSLYNDTDRVRVGNGLLLPIKHVGSLNISTPHQPLVLNNVLHVPSLKHNLLSVK